MHMLYEFLARIAREMGFDYFALAEHIDLRMPQQQPLQIHNYPRGWAAYYVDRDLGPRDPIRRASHRTHSSTTTSCPPMTCMVSPPVDPTRCRVPTGSS